MKENFVSIAKKIFASITYVEPALKFSSASRDVILQAQSRAGENGNIFVDIDHFLFSLAHGGALNGLLEELGINAAVLKADIDSQLNEKPLLGVMVNYQDARLTDAAREVLFYSGKEAEIVGTHKQKIDPEHIFLGLLRYYLESPIGLNPLQRYNLTLDKAREEVKNQLQHKGAALPPIPALPEQGTKDSSIEVSSPFVAVLLVVIVLPLLIFYLLWITN
jgi:ATP-dependent Clp protease ATP-binding subunit ClpA